jgi:hypothetical protein
MIIARGDPDAGALMVVLCDRGADYRAYERMPSLRGANLAMRKEAQRRIAR